MRPSGSDSPRKRNARDDAAQKMKRIGPSWFAVYIGISRSTPFRDSIEFHGISATVNVLIDRKKHKLFY